MSAFQLKVQKVDQVCLFELTWGRGQQLGATVDYPTKLTELYQEWQRIYLSFYKTVQMPIVPISVAGSEAAWRGWTIASGNTSSAPIDWHARLVEAETKLLRAFHSWLRSAELFEIRAAISAPQAAETVSLSAIAAAPTTVFLVCTPIELARLPWEVWEIGADFAASGSVSVVRQPANIRNDTEFPQRRGRTRILAILGDDTGLNFQADREAVNSLGRIAEITFIGWQPGQTAAEVKTQICQALVAEAGWDVLFFAGHSNETAITGGELAIAPNVSLCLSELAPQLTLAKQRGLQFAIFNSCSGLTIAESLIDLGFSQVAVMREPIHNRVAQEFLRRFLRHLAAHQTVQMALIATCQFLRSQKNLTYPSAYLVPSLFCHPGAVLFQIPPTGWRHQVRQALPNLREAIGLAACLTLSLAPPVQDFLTDQRFLWQSVYRDLTAQVPATTPPPVALIQIDEASVRRDRRLAQPVPINRAYLADLIDQLAKRNARTIGIDYLLDRTIGNEPQLAATIRAVVAQRQSWVVFGTTFSEFESEALFAPQESQIADQRWSLQGYLEAFSNRVMLPTFSEDCRQSCPFAYLLAAIQLAHQTTPVLPQPHLDSRTDLRTQLWNQIEPIAAAQPSSRLAVLQRSRLSPMAVAAYQILDVPWLQPMIDFSIPPDRIYDRIAAWRVMTQPLDLPHLPQQVALIAPGGYTEAGGITEGKADYFSVPTAVTYWQWRLPPQNQAATFPNGNSQNVPAYLPVFTGGEIHAYTIHHLLTRRLVVPLPDLWLVGLAGLLGKAIALIWQRRSRWALLGVTWVYGLVSLQLYLSAAILLPIALPLLTFWFYVMPPLQRKKAHV